MDNNQNNPTNETTTQTTGRVSWSSRTLLLLAESGHAEPESTGAAIVGAVGFAAIMLGLVLVAAWRYGQIGL